MKVIGLTGGIATGKSTVSAILRELGLEVIDADAVARELVTPGSDCLRALVDEFGREILNPDGTLNRKKLGRMVFADPKKLERLNEITHPAIVNEIKRRMEIIKGRSQGPPQAAVIDAPLLFEVGLDEIVDEVWVVTLDEEEQLKRLVERDGLTRAEAEARLRAQMPLSEKIKRADIVIDNSGSLESVMEKVKGLWRDSVEVRWSSNHDGDPRR